MIKISLRSEYIIRLLGIDITNTFVTSLLVTTILGIVGILFYYNKFNNNNIIINGFRVLIYKLLNLTDSVSGDRKLSKKILPIIATFFLFIVTANLFALIPGFLGSFFINSAGDKIPILRSPNSDLTTTFALAIVSVVSIQYYSLKELGFKNYLKRFINMSNPIGFILGFFEIISEAIKLLSFSFRLFGNIFAGEVLLLVIAFLVPYVIPLPFLVLEVFVGIIQAFIFAVLTLTFIKSAAINKEYR